MKFLHKTVVHLWIAVICGTLSLLYWISIVLYGLNIISCSWWTNIRLLWLAMLATAIAIFAGSYGLLRKIPKSIHSWSSLICGTFSFMWLVHQALYDLHIISYPMRLWWLRHWMESLAWVAMAATTVAVFSGGYGIAGKVNRVTWMRSLVGLIFGILFWLIFVMMYLPAILWD